MTRKARDAPPAGSRGSARVTMAASTASPSEPLEARRGTSGSVVRSIPRRHRGVGDGDRQRAVVAERDGRRRARSPGRPPCARRSPTLAGRQAAGRANELDERARQRRAERQSRSITCSLSLRGVKPLVLRLVVAAPRRAAARRRRPRSSSAASPWTRRASGRAGPTTTCGGWPLAKALAARRAADELVLGADTSWSSTAAPVSASRPTRPRPRRCCARSPGAPTRC